MYHKICFSSRRDKYWKQVETSLRLSVLTVETMWQSASPLYCHGFLSINDVHSETVSRKELLHLRKKGKGRLVIKTKQKAENVKFPDFRI